MTNAEKKELGRNLYVKTDMKRKEIAQRIGASEKTLRKWIEENEWDKMRDSLQITRPQLLNDAYVQLNAINIFIKQELKNIPNKEMSDAKAVLRKEIETFSTQPIHKYIEVFEEFIEYLSKTEPAQITVFANLSQKFINALSKSK